MQPVPAEDGNTTKEDQIQTAEMAAIKISIENTDNDVGEKAPDDALRNSDSVEPHKSPVFNEQELRLPEEIGEQAEEEDEADSFMKSSETIRTFQRDAIDRRGSIATIASWIPPAVQSRQEDAPEIPETLTISSWCKVIVDEDYEERNPEEIPMPAPLSGKLKKKSGGGWLGLKGWDERYVVVKKMKLYYWKSEQAMKAAKSEAQGILELASTACQVLPHHGEAHLFTIRPKGGVWLEGSFKGADAGREFVFDASKSEHTRDTWVRTITEHLEHMHGKEVSKTRIRRAFAPATNG